MFGVSPVDFWGMTPYLTRHAMNALSDKTNMAAWIQAGLNRVKKMPKLEKLMTKAGGKDTGKKDMEARLKAALQSIGTRKKGI